MYLCRCSSGVERVIGNDEAAGSIPARGLVIVILTRERGLGVY